MMFYGNQMSGWGYAFMVVSALLSWSVLAAVVYVLVRRSRPGPATGGHPEQVLAHRYASGEIDDDEYRRRLSILHDAAPAHRPAP